jgi:hypothetical protein
MRVACGATRGCSRTVKPAAESRASKATVMARSSGRSRSLTIYLREDIPWERHVLDQIAAGNVRPQDYLRGLLRAGLQPPSGAIPPGSAAQWLPAPLEGDGVASADAPQLPLNARSTVKPRPATPNCRSSLPICPSPSGSSACSAMTLVN